MTDLRRQLAEAREQLLQLGHRERTSEHRRLVDEIVRLQGEIGAMETCDSCEHTGCALRGLADECAVCQEVTPQCHLDCYDGVCDSCWDDTEQWLAACEAEL